MVMRSQIQNKESIFWCRNMNTQEKTMLAIKLLKDKAEILGRLPQKNDFDKRNSLFYQTKARSWPRALVTGLTAPHGNQCKRKEQTQKEYAAEKTEN